jgi:hypothetical protein
MLSVYFKVEILLNGEWLMKNKMECVLSYSQSHGAETYLIFMQNEKLPL